MRQLRNLPVLPWACVIIRWLRRTFTDNHGNKKNCSLACATTIIELRNSWPGVGLKARHLIFFFTSIYTQRVPDFKLEKKNSITRRCVQAELLCWTALTNCKTSVSPGPHYVCWSLATTRGLGFNTAGRKTASPRSLWLWGRAVRMLWWFLSPLGPGSQPRANTLTVTVNTEQRLSSDADVFVLISDLCRALFTLHVCHLK